MNKLKCNNFLETKTENSSLAVKFFFNLQNHPIFHSEERFLLARGRECFVGLSTVYIYYYSIPSNGCLAGGPVGAGLRFALVDVRLAVLTRVAGLAHAEVHVHCTHVHNDLRDYLIPMSFK